MINRCAQLVDAVGRAVEILRAGKYAQEFAEPVLAQFAQAASSEPQSCGSRLAHAQVAVVDYSRLRSNATDTAVYGVIELLGRALEPMSFNDLVIFDRLGVRLGHALEELSCGNARRILSLHIGHWRQEESWSSIASRPAIQIDPTG